MTEGTPDLGTIPQEPSYGIPEQHEQDSLIPSWRVGNFDVILGTGLTLTSENQEGIDGEVMVRLRPSEVLQLADLANEHRDDLEREAALLDCNATQCRPSIKVRSPDSGPKPIPVNENVYPQANEPEA